MKLSMEHADKMSDNLVVLCKQKCKLLENKMQGKVNVHMSMLTGHENKNSFWVQWPRCLITNAMTIILVTLCLSCCLEITRNKISIEEKQKNF